MGLNSADSHSYLQREATQRENPSVVKFLRLKEKSSPLFICKETKSLRNQLREIMVSDTDRVRTVRSLLTFNGLGHGEGVDCLVLTDM